MAVDRGLLFLVVGPSGVGKDTLIAHARGALADNPRFSFPRRLITRGRDAVGEDHVALSQAEFERGLANGGYALSWQAHGHAYALPWDLEQCLRCGVHVVANVSRTVIGEARIRFAPVRVIAVEAAPELLAARLSERGRETAAEQQDRLARRDLAVPPGPDVVRFVNDPPLADARARFTDLLRGLDAARQATSG